MIQRARLITGVNSGFGRHMTEQLLARGDRVADNRRKGIFIMKGETKSDE